MTQMQWIKAVNGTLKTPKSLRPVGLVKSIKCACGWEGTAEDMIAEWSDIEPHCPECWNSRDFEEVICHDQENP